MTLNDFVFACPVCLGELEELGADSLHCSVDDLTFGFEAGIWRFLPPERATALAQFRQEYETVRRSEGRGSDDPAFYRALPFVRGNGTRMNADDTEMNQQISQNKKIGKKSDKSAQSLMKNSWKERARRYERLVGQVVTPFEQSWQRPLKILDLGAGNGWLSNRLAARGHVVAAVDLGVNEWDGLGAHRHYETDIVCVQAEFDKLPLAAGQVDLAIFNASLHYAVDVAVTLGEAVRVLRPGGWVVVVDTAVYQHPASGQQMVAEREAAFLQRYGFASNALPSENFLTPARLNQLAAALRLRWRKIETVPTWRRWIRRAKVALRRQREPAQFPIIIFATEGTEVLEG